MIPFQIGPVDITRKDGDTARKPYPSRAHRPRSTTESGPRRHISIDYPPRCEEDDVKDSLSSSVGTKHIGSPDKSGQKKLPTIIKYAGQGKEVFLCGT